MAPAGLAALFGLCPTSSISQSADFPSTAPGAITDISSGLQFCNDSGLDSVEISIMHQKSGGAWISEGYWTINDGECVVVLNQLVNRYVYYHARSGRSEWSGDFAACVSRGEIFEYDVQQCPRSARSVGFREIDTEGYAAFDMYLD